MSMGTRRNQLHPETLAVALLGTTFLVVTLLLVQALLTLRAHERTLEAHQTTRVSELGQTDPGSRRNAPP